MRHLFLLVCFFGFYATLSAQIFTDSRRTFSYTDDSTVMPGDVNVHHILFDFGSCNYYIEYKDTLDKIAEYLIRHSNIQVEISLHIGPLGSSEGNLKLTQCRASRMAAFFEEKGVSKNQCKVVGRGEEEVWISEESIAAEPDEETRERYHKMNRRVEVKITSVSLK